MPEGKDDAPWHINAYEDPAGPPTWGTYFSESAPTEFVQVFTAALARAYEQGPDAYLARPGVPGADDHHDPFQVLAPLVIQGWKFDHPRWGVNALRAPDGLAGLEFVKRHIDLNPEGELTTRDARWQLWAGESIDRPAWYVTASTNTPVPLLTALTECAADPTPLPRWREDTFSYIEGMAQLTPIQPPGPPAPTPLDVQRAAAFRPTPALPAAASPCGSTTVRPALPGPCR
ncbi:MULTISPECIES: DUF317 domain-containing protein [Streptomyces]|uniref:DUF317 domain-containing protein n=1 Tax=Streptomyces ramulosus TaxID=47762 RepID=A0ABW1FVP3_9ACTN